MQPPLFEELTEILKFFQLHGAFFDAVLIKSGHIHESYKVTFNEEKTLRKYILQKINQRVFPKAELLMGNMWLVTDHLRRKVKSRGGNPLEEVITIIRTLQEGFLHIQPDGSAWRMFRYIDHTQTFQTVQSEVQVYQAGLAIGNFIASLAEFPVNDLVETIPRFHDTPSRFEDFLAALNADPEGRAEDLQQEIDFVLERRSRTARLVEMLKSGDLPLRVTHNDTKISNVLFDQETGNAICLIDLDTVMPGTSLYDFGDAARTMTAAAEEDEPDLSLVGFNEIYFEKLTAGFIHGMQGKLTEEELAMIPLAAVLMTLECGIRFLGDHLNGDIYFHTDYPDHNLVRARVQFRMVEYMEANLDEMIRVVAAVQKGS